MLRTILFLSVVIVVYGQKPDPSITFEVASVKLAQPLDPTVRPAPCVGGPGTSDPGRYTCRQTLAVLVATAFDLRPYQWSVLSSREAFSFPPGAPAPAYWEVAAKVPPGATREQFRTMLQNLLIDRFKLAYHFEKKEMDIYELAVTKGGPKLKESQPNPTTAADQTAPRAPGPPTFGPDGCPVTATRTGVSEVDRNGVGCVMGLGASIAQLASYLSNPLVTPVTDATALKGTYDFKLRYSPASIGRGAEMGDAPGLFQAIQSDLGLQLEKKKAPVDVFVVDHVEKAPTEN
jgi:uncharacterized protein (TIGR03435 family)